MPLLAAGCYLLHRVQAFHIISTIVHHQILTNQKQQQQNKNIKFSAQHKHQLPDHPNTKPTAGLDKLNLYEAVYFLGWIFMKHFSQDFLWKKKELSGTLLNPHPKKKETTIDYWPYINELNIKNSDLVI